MRRRTWRATSSDSCGRNAKWDSESVLTQQALADDGLLDFAGALADQEERCVAHQALHLVLLGVAVATVDAEALLGDVRTIFAGKVFGHARRDVVALARVLQPGRVDHHQVRRLDLG